MTKIKVLVVDDSLTMRVLISSALERINGVEVVGGAGSAAEARRMVAILHPDVMTLDVELPGMSGLEYLAEVMETRPMPVIMFSTLTETGAEASIEALRLGAIDCFPKPKVAVQSELDAIIRRLSQRVQAAMDIDLKRPMPRAGNTVPTAIDWNGNLLAIGADAAGTSALFDLFQSFPANCPPTLVVQHIGPGLLAPMVEQLAEQVAPRVVIAHDGMAAEQGSIYVAPQGDHHLVIDTWPNGRLRLLPDEPGPGERPSIARLFAAVSRVCAARGVGMLIALDDQDGAAGIQALIEGGSYAIARTGKAFTVSKGAASQSLDRAGLARMALKLCSR